MNLTLIDPRTNAPISNHRTRAGYLRALERAMRPVPAQRNAYDALVMPGASTILGLYRDILDEEYSEWDKKQRGSALNHDLYGFDLGQDLAVIQARQAYRRSQKYPLATRKTYFLVGRNEITGRLFRHPVSSHAIRAAVNKGATPAEVVEAAQRWMWEVTSDQLAASTRQGDVLLVPSPRAPGADARDAGTTYTVGESHVVEAEAVRINGRVYGLNPVLTHSKGQHAPVRGEGWMTIRLARESDAWDFASRIGD